MKKILVPVDFSPCADNACEYAYQLARATGASLRILHVMYDPIVQADLPGYGYAATGSNTDNVRYRVELDARKSLRYLQERYETKAEWEQLTMGISLALRNGFPESEIKEECSQWQPDLILMGTHGRGRIAQTLLGSVSARVIEQVPVPVLAIPEGVSYKRIAHILYASNLEAKDGANACAIGDLFGAFSPAISCVNVLWDTNRKLQPWQYSTIRQELESLIRAECPDGNLRFDVLEGSDLAERLNNYIVENNTDVLVMAMHHRNVLEKLFSHSHTKTMLGKSRIPLLAMHVG